VSGFLLDTNVPSELTRIKPDRRVAQWLEDADDDELYLSVISIGEFCKGFTIHPDLIQKLGIAEGSIARYASGLPPSGQAVARPSHRPQ